MHLEFTPQMLIYSDYLNVVLAKAAELGLAPEICSCTQIGRRVDQPA
jgi:hypothetical protein